MKTAISIPLFGAALLAFGCGSAGNGGSAADSAAAAETPLTAPFDADSAYSYVKRQVDFGPRVPNTAAHRAAGDWLAGELRRHGAEVTVQSATLTAFDGTKLRARNIFGQFNPASPRRVLLLAHYDTRPWADNDPDEARRKTPVDGANDGASGVGVLLELARQLGARVPAAGIDILFTDAEDYGTDGDDGSWAMGSRYFIENPVKEGYRPDEAILLDMVGAPGATFPREWFSSQAAPALQNTLWSIAAQLGYGEDFTSGQGGAINDDHVPLIEAGIPAVDIIDLRPTGFCDRWHTASDNMEGISAETLGKVGRTVSAYVYSIAE